jgi:Tol biopolymer transport system component
MRRLPALLALLALSLALSACGSGGNSQQVSDSASGSAAGLRFLLAAQDGLSEMTAGSAEKPIVKWDNQSYPLDPAISPDGKSIAFALQVPAIKLPTGDVDFGSDLYVSDADGNNVKALLKHKAIAEFIRSPAWLSSGELLYTVRGRTAGGRADFRIEKIDISTGKITRFLDWGVDPATSKDGKKVVWDQIDPDSQAEALMVANVDLSARKTLVDATSKLSLFSSQVFSPDATKVAFAAVDLNQITGGALPLGRLGAAVAVQHPYAQDVWVVNSDGTGLRRLAEIAENMPSLTWSGDGSVLYALGASALWRIDPDSGKADEIALGIPQAQIVWLSGP